MKKFINSILTLVFIFLILVGCEVKTKYIEGDLESTSQIYDLNEFKLEDIKIIATKENGNQKKFSLTEDMLTTADLLLLDTPGEHEVTVTYDGHKVKITIKLSFDDVNYQLLRIYQKLVMFDSYYGTYENWLEGFSEPTKKITNASINQEREIIITFSDGSNRNAGRLYTSYEVGNSVNLVSINDTHGSLYSESTPGLDKVQSAISFMEEEYGEHIKIATGDIFQGSYVSNVNFGLPLLEALNAMEFNAFVIGNHEFDWGIEKIAQYKDGDQSNGEADFPFLAANIVYKSTGERLSWTEDYVIVENNGYKVGIIGVIGYGLESSIASDKVADYEFLSSASIVQEHSKTLREELNCDFVFVACHNYATWEISSFINLPYESRIDGVIAGHSHQMIGTKMMRSDYYEVPIIQSNDKNQTIGQVIVQVDNDNNPIDAFTYHHNPFHFPSDAAIVRLIGKYSKDIEEGNRIIGYTTEQLYKNRIGAEATTAMVERYDADIAFINTAGVREVIKTGEIRVKDIFEVFPFDNKVVVVNISGKVFKELYHQQGSYLYFNQTLDLSKIKDNDNYKIATIDYVYIDNRYQKYFKNTSGEEQDLMRDVFIDYIEEFYKK